MPRPPGRSPPGASGWCGQRSLSTRAWVSGTRSVPRCAGACLSGRWSSGASCCPGLPLPAFLPSAILSLHLKSLTQAGSEPPSCLRPVGRHLWLLLLLTHPSSGSPLALLPASSRPLGTHPETLEGEVLRLRPPSLLVSFFLVRMLLRFSPGFEARPRCGRMTGAHTWRPACPPCPPSLEAVCWQLAQGPPRAPGHTGCPADSAVNTTSAFSMAIRTHLPPIAAAPLQERGWVLLGVP